MKKLVIFNVERHSGNINWRMVENVEKQTTDALFQKEYKPTPKDRLYIFPGCTIPRFKLKGACDKYNIAVSKTKDKANVLIADPKSDIEKMYFKTWGWGYQAFKQPLLAFLRKSSADLGELIQAIENLEEDIVVMQYSAINTLREHGLRGRHYKLVDQSNVDNGDADANEINSLVEVIELREFQSSEAEAAFMTMANSKSLYHQDAIIRLINSNAAVIDEAMYQSLRSMFLSKDTADMQVAMEAMANSDNEKSIAYLLLLYKEFGSEIYNHPARNHVNFKSLTAYLGGKSYRMFSLNIDNCVGILAEKNLLTSANMKFLMAEAKQIVKEEGETECFVISDVTPTEEIQKIIYETDLANAPIVAPTAEPITSL